VSITGGLGLDSLAGGNKSYMPFGSFEFFDVAGVRKATTYGEFNSHGQDSWVNGQRSLDFVSRDECGYNSAIKEKIFPNNERADFQRIILRAAGDDNYPDGSNIKGGGAHLRDAYLQNLVRRGGMQLDVRQGEKAIVYVNGRYWGVYDLRERPDDHDYTEFNYGQGKYDLQFIQTWGQTWAQYGDDKALKDWEKFATYVEKNDMKDPAKFKIVTDQLDVKSLSDYIITNSVSACSDWLNYNTGWWRGKNPTGTHKKWGFHLWDNDATFGYYINYTGIPDTAANKAKPCDVEALKDSVEVTFGPQIAEDTIKFNGQIFYPGDTLSPAFTFKAFSDLNKHMKIFGKLLENPEFKQFYITRYTDLMQTVFSQKNMLAFLDEEYNRIKPEMPAHIKKWGGTMKEWEFNVHKLRDYIIRRTNYLNEGMRNCYKLTGPYEATFNITGVPNASIEINSQKISKFPYTAQYFGNIATKVVASPTNPKDFMFEQWTATNGTDVAQAKNATTSLQIKANTAITAAFVKAIIAVSEVPNEVVTNNVKAFPTLFNTNLQVQYELAKTADVVVRLVDITGKTIVTANDFNATHAPGAYTMSLDLQHININQGVYFLDFQAGSFHKTLKVVKQ
jgi:CotH kinase protein